MLLEPVAFLLIFGLTVWLIGQYFQYTGVATIGATLIIIAGSAIALTGLEVPAGEVRNYHYQLEDNGTEYVLNQTDISVDYRTTAIGEILNVGAAASLGLGGLIMLLGAVLLSQTLADEVI